MDALKVAQQALDDHLDASHCRAPAFLSDKILLLCHALQYGKVLARALQKHA